MTGSEQISLFADDQDIEAVSEAVFEILSSYTQPSAWELLKSIDSKFGLKARWALEDAIQTLISGSACTRSQKDYLIDLIDSEDWKNALRGEERPAREIESTIDALLRESSAYRNSAAFQEMVSFMANFREYAPFNNMLVKLQNPSCSFFATQKHWHDRFERHIKEDARPMLILAPRHPVMLVYDLDSTDGKPLPQKLQEFAKYEGEWETNRLERTVANASARDLIRVNAVKLSSTNAGFAIISAGKNGMKMRIGLHEELDDPSAYGVLLHELAHIYLGHLGGDKDGWWPSRRDLGRRAMEVEAEAVAYIVSKRAGLKGASHQYVSGYLDGETTLKMISLDQIAKVSGRLEEMGKHFLGKRRSRRNKGQTQEGKGRE